jgi:hypothetical protein
MGRKFTVKQDSLRRALDRACEDEADQRFTRELSNQKSRANYLFMYGLVNW